MEKRGILDWPLVCVQLLNRCWVGGGGGISGEGKKRKNLGDLDKVAL